MSTHTPEIIERLKKIEIFKRMKNLEDDIQKIANLIQIKTYRKDTPIIEEGLPGDEMYILNKGQVRIEKKTLEKEPYTVVKLTDGMNIFFGELALIDEDLRSASVIAESDCECFVIDRKGLDILAEKEPQICVVIYREIARIISSRLRKSNDELIKLFGVLIREIMAE